MKAPTAPIINAKAVAILRTAGGGCFKSPSAAAPAAAECEALWPS
jgi:hypothetical protein